jgi:hypothetical protein
VDQSWSEISRQAEWRRRRRVLALVGVLVACGGIMLHAERGRDAPSEVSAGRVAGNRPVDTSPFEPAKPDRTGSTTLPDSMFGDAGSEEASATATTSTAPDPGPSNPVPAVPPTDPICLTARHIAVALRLIEDNAPLPAAAEEVRLASTTIADDDSPGNRRLADPLASLAVQISQAPSSEAALALVNTIFDPDNDAIAPLAGSFREHMASTCSELLG